MTEGSPAVVRHAADAGAAQRPARNWDAVTAMVAIFIGVLALVVSAYTANLQRQQVRAEVWPNLLVGFNDPDQAVGIHNKGVGPAIVGSVSVRVDGKPRRNWAEVFGALEIPIKDFTISTINNTVISPGERINAITLNDLASYRALRSGLETRARSEICYCSTLGECWIQGDRGTNIESIGRSIDHCPVLAEGDAFID